MKLSNMSQLHLSSTMSMIGIFLTIFTSVQVLRMLYIMFVGPMSKFPGPKYAKVTRLVLLWHKIKGDAEWYTLTLHQKHGDIVQLAPGQLSFATGHAWKDIYGHLMGNKKQTFPKDPIFYGNRPVGVADLIYSNDADHSRQRRNFSHAFSDRALREQEPLIRGYVDQLIESIGKKNGEKLDMVRWYNFTTFDIMADLAFGEPLGCLTQGEYTPWVALVFQSIKVGSFMTEMRFTPFLKPFLKAFVGKSAAAKRAKHWKLSADQVDKRLARGAGDRPDIWGFVLNAKEQQQLTLPEMHSNAQLVMLAGTETTATLLSGLTYNLLKNPEKMDLVKKEVRESFSSPDQIDLDAVLKLKYLNACFEEALRCYPPVPSALLRDIPKGGDFVCGQFIPEGTRVGVHQLSTYRNPNNFRRPTEFVPERWLGDSEFDHDQKDALQPFNVGPRNCLGKNLAYLEMRLIFANVIWHYNINLCEESQDWSDQNMYLLWEKHPLMCTLDPVHGDKFTTEEKRRLSV